MKEVGLFVDFENVRYGVRNTYHRELNVSLLMEKAKSYGTVRLAKAYADFATEHPAKFMRQLYTTGIEAVNLPKRQVGPHERKNSADIHIIMDMVESLLGQPSIGTYVLMAGDSDYIRIVTLARNRFEKKVIISGVPGTMSQDLIAAAGGKFDPFVPPPLSSEERIEKLIRKVDQLEKMRLYLTFKYISDAAASDAEFEFETNKQSMDFVSQVINEEIFERYTYQKRYKALRLNRVNTKVVDVLGYTSPS